VSTHSDIVRTKRHLSENADRLWRKLALNATGRIMKRTPVDKGRAINNWNVAVGRPDWDTTEDVNPNATEDKFRHVIADSQFGDAMYITNGLPYIHRLEYGWSKKSPAGMVRVTAIELQPLANQIAARIRNGVGG